MELLWNVKSESVTTLLFIAMLWSMHVNRVNLEYFYTQTSAMLLGQQLRCVSAKEQSHSLLCDQM